MIGVSGITWPTRVGLTDFEVVQADTALRREELRLVSLNFAMGLETEICNELR